MQVSTIRVRWRRSPREAYRNQKVQGRCGRNPDHLQRSWKRGLFSWRDGHGLEAIRCLESL
jgi:hypothetical protein